MKKVLFSGVMCATFIISGVLVSNEKVFAVCVGFSPNGVVENGEQCDDGNFINTDGCNASCEIVSVCGDGIVGGTEECDDQNSDFMDSCENNCQISCMNRAPNGIVEGYEQCDDGNDIYYDGCNPDCTLSDVAVCGNGIREGGEQCDDGNDVNEDNCKNTCENNYCGDDVWNPGKEECDGGVGCIIGECHCYDNGVVSDGQGGCKAPDGDDDSDENNNNPGGDNNNDSDNDSSGGSNDSDDNNDDDNNDSDNDSSGGSNDSGDNNDDEASDSESGDNEGDGDFRVKIKTYDCNGNEESKKIQGSKVKLYKSSGKKVDEDKTNFKGESNFYDVKEGKYNVKCEVPGYVSLKDRSKDYYKSGSEKVKDGKRAHETCHLIKSSCDANVKVNKLAQTGGSLKDLISYIFSFVF